MILALRFQTLFSSEEYFVFIFVIQYVRTTFSPTGELAWRQNDLVVSTLSHGTKCLFIGIYVRYRKPSSAPSQAPHDLCVVRHVKHIAFVLINANGVQ